MIIMMMMMMIKDCAVVPLEFVWGGAHTHTHIVVIYNDKESRGS